MKALVSLFAVFGLAIIALLGAGALGWHTLFGVVIPYVAFFLFFAGVAAKVLGWSRVPVPFRIPTTAGQQYSLDWVKQSKLDNPSTTWQTIGRMALEVLFFRTLFRNQAAQISDRGKGVDAKLRYASAKWLWLFGILFHYSFLVVVVRHMRLFTDPVPVFLTGVEFIDGLLQIGVPTLYLSSVVLLAGALLLLLRRLILPQMRYLSQASDYFPLFLILSIAGSGVLMRYFAKVQVMSVKELLMGMMTFRPVIPEGIGVVFYVHLFLVCVLVAYFPFSKLMHLGGIFLSPTRNLPNNTRMVRHINPWNPAEIKPHSYASYEDEFREKMIEAGLPVEKGAEEGPVN
jgi:nitrate reductase gamma subunit